MRLVTYNIHKGIGGLDRKYRLDRIIAVLSELAPDVICLQEVDRNTRRSSFDNQPLLLSGAMGCAASLDQFIHPHRGGGYGNMILSRWSFADCERISLRKGQRRRRGALMATIATSEGSLFVASGHLGLNNQERKWQVEQLLSDPRFTQFAHLPTILAFDSNDWRDSLITGSLAREGFTQATSPPSHFRTFPAFLPSLSLDKIFVRGAIVIHSLRAVNTPLSRMASDHLPVLLEFSMEELPQRIAPVTAGDETALPLLS
jgi:endonuclease/exonuclease/phosphatase family metal-dependent hydrolase